MPRIRKISLRQSYTYFTPSFTHMSIVVPVQWVRQKKGAQYLVHGVTGIGGTRLSSYLEDYWPYTGVFPVVNAIGTHLRVVINSALARWRMAVLVETVAERGKRGWSRVNSA